MSPELWIRNGLACRNQKAIDLPMRQSDCYALGIVIYEVPPICRDGSDVLVINAIVERVPWGAGGGNTPRIYPRTVEDR